MSTPLPRLPKDMAAHQHTKPEKAIFFRISMRSRCRSRSLESGAVMRCRCSCLFSLLLVARTTALALSAGKGWMVQDLPAGKGSFLLFQWNQAAMTSRANGFSPTSEAVGEGAYRMKVRTALFNTPWLDSPLLFDHSSLSRAPFLCSHETPFLCLHDRRHRLSPAGTG